MDILKLILDSSGANSNDLGPITKFILIVEYILSNTDSKQDDIVVSSASN